MKRLILMRHAKTEPWIEGVDDHARALTATGHGAAAAMAVALKSEGWVPDVVLVSSARRTRETWKHLSQVFEDCKVIVEEGLYLAGERGICDYIDDVASASCVMVLGHNPGMQDLSLRLLRGAGSRDHQAARRVAAKMPTGGAALFEADEDGAFSEFEFRLHNFIRPKDVLD